MSRGRRPAVAVSEAADHCSRNGLHVLPISGIRKGADLIVIGVNKIRLLRVRNPHRIISDPADAAFHYGREIAELRELPFSDVLEKELMLLGPDGNWHTFRILPDTVERIE